MRRKRLLTIAALSIITIGGCDAFYRQSADPNSNLSKTLTTVETAADAAAKAGAAAGTAGIPYGWIVAAIGTALSSAIGAYKNKTKNKIIADEASKYIDLETTARGVIAAVEAVKNTPATADKTVGEIIKSEVEDQLKNREAYLIGRAIINALKQ